ncbi:Lon protease [Anaplasma phagocytophilum]|nr:Lon protease [Anaplasma phagocytophilum]
MIIFPCVFVYRVSMIRSLTNTTRIFRLSHYLDNNYDSKVIFVATVNNLNFQQPLLDSIEIIQLFVYTEEEKLQIGLLKVHLIPGFA